MTRKLHYRECDELAAEKAEDGGDEGELLVCRGCGEFMAAGNELARHDAYENPMGPTRALDQSDREKL